MHDKIAYLAGHGVNHMEDSGWMA